MGMSDVARDSEKRGTKYSIGIPYWYRRNWVMIRPILVSLISPILHYGIRPNLVSTESHVHGESNAVVFKGFG